MRRAIVAVPLASLAIGGLLALWHGAVRPRAADPVPPPASEEGPAGGSSNVSPPRLQKRISAAPRAAPPTGTLQVFVHAGGRGQGGARVTLMRHEDPGRMEVSTTPDGTQTVLNAPAGGYEIVVNHPKFLPANASVRIETGKTAELVVELKEGGRLQGMVADPRGQPLQGVQVSMLNLDTQLLLHPYLVTSTDAGGRYLLEGIPLVEAGVQFRHPRHAPLARHPLRFSFGGDTQELNVTLDPGSMIGGRVVDEAGLPVAEASVTAVNEHFAIAKSDPEGVFAIYGLGGQPVSCSISARGYGTVIVRGVKPNTANLEVRLPKGGRLSGAVVGEPAPDSFAVILVRFEQDLGKELRVQTKTFPNLHNGSFELQDVAPGVYWVEVEAEGYQTVDRPQVVVYAGQSAGNVKVVLQKKR